MQEPLPATSTEGTSLQRGQALVELGREHFSRAEYEQALSCLQQAYGALSPEEQMDQGAEIANDIGVVYTELAHWREAERWLSKAQTQFAASGDLGGEAQTLGNIGSMHRKRGDRRQAAAYLRLSADRFHLVGDDARRTASLRALSLVRMNQLRPLQAVATYYEALLCHPHPNVLVKLLRALFGLLFSLRNR